MRFRSHCALVLVLGFGNLASGLALAQGTEVRLDPESEALALEAQEVLSEHCAEAAAGETTQAAESIAVVSDVWARVSARLELSKKVYLLYWRGVLGQCLSQEARALDDLQTFVRAREGSELWAGLVVDAKKRVRRLSGQAPQAPAGRPGIGLGVALGLGAGALAAGATASWLQSQTTAQNIYLDDDLKGAELDTAVAEGAQNAQISAALTVSSIACGVGSVLSFVLAASMPPKVRMATVVPPVLVVGPFGAGLAWEMTW